MFLSPAIKSGWMINTDSMGITLFPRDLCQKFSQLSGAYVLPNGVGGETYQQVKTRFDAKQFAWGLNQIFFAGFNNVSDAANDYAQDVVDIVNTVAAMVAEMPHDRFIIIGIFSGPAAGLQTNAPANIARMTAMSQLNSTYGSKFLETNTTLVNYDKTDTVAIANNHIPTIFQQQGATSHLSDLGLNVLTSLLYDRARSLGYT